MDDVSGVRVVLFENRRMNLRGELLLSELLGASDVMLAKPTSVDLQR